MNRYDIIYADPPWKYGSGGARSGQYASLDYPSMTLDDLKALPVASWANDNAALFMWVTGSFISEALELGRTWGFRFIRVDKVWVKQASAGGRHGVVDPWGMTDCEYLLLFVRGKMCSHQVERNQFVSAPLSYPGKHSAKPHEFREMIERRFGDTIDQRPIKRLEMFAREASAGWDVWGNEAPGCVDLPLGANDNWPAQFAAKGKG